MFGEPPGSIVPRGGQVAIPKRALSTGCCCTSRIPSSASTRALPTSCCHPALSPESGAMKKDGGASFLSRPPPCFLLSRIVLIGSLGPYEMPGLAAASAGLHALRPRSARRRCVLALLHAQHFSSCAFPRPSVRVHRCFLCADSGGCTDGHLRKQQQTSHTPKRLARFVAQRNRISTECADARMSLAVDKPVCALQP